MKHKKYKKAKFLESTKIIVARKKGDKDYTKSEKHLLISLINDYSLFGARNHEVIQMFSKKKVRMYQKLFSIN
jgi:hypothetical protein